MLVEKTELFNTIGVYCIENTINSQKYIGISKIKIDKRVKSHLRQLKNNIHSNEKLQNAYNKYGSDSFKFYVLESFDDINIIELKQKEIYYIDKFDSFKNGYNKTLGGDYNDNTDKIYCYKILNNDNCLEFVLYKIYNGGSEAGRDLNYSSGHIHQVIKGERRSLKLKDYIFINENEKQSIIDLNYYLLEKYKQIQNLPLRGKIKNKPFENTENRKLAIEKRKKKVNMYNLNGELITCFNSINECASYLNIHAANITKVIKGKQKSAKEYTFEYAL